MAKKETIQDRMFVSNEDDGTIVIALDNPGGDLMVLSFLHGRLNCTLLKEVLELVTPIIERLDQIKMENQT